MQWKIVLLVVLILLILAGTALFFAYEDMKHIQELQDMDSNMELLEQNYWALSDNYNGLEAAYNALEQRHLELNEIYNNSITTNAILHNRNEELEQEYAALESLRLPSEIPTSIAIPEMDFLVAPQALFIGHPDMALRTGLNTTSMQPTIGVGHLAIVTSQFDIEDIDIGDIVTYNSSSSDVLIAHRIVEIGEKDEEQCYITQGDNTPEPDRECILPSQILHLVVGVVYSSNGNGYRTCTGDYVGISIEDRLECIRKTLPAGVYTTDQPMDNITGYKLCAEENPPNPYTIAMPNGTVYCDDLS